MSELHGRMLQRAVEILGGADELAGYLGVSPMRLRIWMHGLFALPDDMFLKLVDLINDPPPRKPRRPRRGERPG